MSLSQEVFRNGDQMTWYHQDVNRCFAIKQNTEDLCQAIADYCFRTGRGVDDITGRIFQEEINPVLLGKLLKRCRNKREREQLHDKIKNGTIHQQFRWMQTTQKGVAASMKGNYAVGQLARIRVYELMREKGKINEA